MIPILKSSEILCFQKKRQKKKTQNNVQAFKKALNEFEKKSL